MDASAPHSYASVFIALQVRKRQVVVVLPNTYYVKKHRVTQTTRLENQGDSDFSFLETGLNLTIPTGRIPV